MSWLVYQLALSPLTLLFWFSITCLYTCYRKYWKFQLDVNVTYIQPTKTDDFLDGATGCEGDLLTPAAGGVRMIFGGIWGNITLINSTNNLYKFIVSWIIQKIMWVVCMMFISLKKSCNSKKLYKRHVFDDATIYGDQLCSHVKSAENSGGHHFRFFFVPLWMAFICKDLLGIVKWKWTTKKK